MTTYFEVNSALHAYNSAAVQRGRPALSANDVITRCGVAPRVFFEDCNAVRQARTPPPLTPDLEALAAVVLRDLENETAAVLSGRSNGAGGGDGPDDELKASDDREAGDAIGANADDDDDEEIGAGVSAGADADSVDAEGTLVLRPIAPVQTLATRPIQRKLELMHPSARNSRVSRI